MLLGVNKKKKVRSTPSHPSRRDIGTGQYIGIIKLILKQLENYKKEFNLGYACNTKESLRMEDFLCTSVFRLLRCRFPPKCEFSVAKFLKTLHYKHGFSNPEGKWTQILGDLGTEGLRGEMLSARCGRFSRSTFGYFHGSALFSSYKEILGSKGRVKP